MIETSRDERSGEAMMKRATLTALSLASAMIAAASASAPPAAAYEDTFCVLSVWKCPSHGARAGRACFVDYGPGVPGNDKGNDDYVVIDDFCRDHHGVKAWAWRNGALLGWKYNGKGNKRRVIWDPYGTHNNIKKNDYIGLKVCSVDGPSGAPFPGCTEGTRRSVDG
jgi:hypothetical protein